MMRAGVMGSKVSSYKLIQNSGFVNKVEFNSSSFKMLWLIILTKWMLHIQQSLYLNLFMPLSLNKRQPIFINKSIHINDEIRDKIQFTQA